MLAIAEEGATADLMAETGAGRCFSESDTAGIRDYLGDLIAGKLDRSTPYHPKSLSRFAARHLTERLVARLSAADDGATREAAVEG